MTDFFRSALPVERNHVQIKGQRKFCRREADFIVTGLVAKRRRNPNGASVMSGCKGDFTLDPDFMKIDGNALVNDIQMQNFWLGEFEHAFTQRGVIHDAQINRGVVRARCIKMHPVRKLDVGHQQEVIAGAHRILGSVGDEFELWQLNFGASAATNTEGFYQYSVGSVALVMGLYEELRPDDAIGIDDIRAGKRDAIAEHAFGMIDVSDSECIDNF